MKHCTNLIFIFTLLAVNILGIVAQERPIANSHLQTIKDKWLQWANNNVEDEKRKILESYRLDDMDFKKLWADPQFICGTKACLDRVSANKINFNETTSSTHSKLHRIAQEIFGTGYYSSVEFLHDPNPTRQFDHINVVHNYADNKIFISANGDLLSEQTEETIRSVFLHEYSHIIHEDALHSDILKACLFCNSQDSVEKIGEMVLPFDRAYETRADVYAAIHSADHGSSAIKFLEKSLAARIFEGESLCHPSITERISLFQKIKDELDSARHKASV